MKVVQLSGGVGGARLARGFSALDEVELTVIVNVGDDAEVHGLAVSPDIDTVCYSLAGIEGPFGWGRRKETFNFNEELATYGIDNSFRLGDRDLALKLARTVALSRGETLSEFTATATKALDIRATVLPATNDRLRTAVRLPDGWTSFIDYFVTRRHQDEVREIEFEGAAGATAAPGVVEALTNADLVVFGPSNPVLSIWPILAVTEIRAVLEQRRDVSAVSPLIGGKAIKGPAREVMVAQGLHPDIYGLAGAYDGLLSRLFVDVGDVAPLDDVEVVGTNVMATTLDESMALANQILDK